MGFRATCGVQSHQDHSPLTHPVPSARHRRSLAAVAGAAVLAVVLVGCAPEPEHVAGGDAKERIAAEAEQEGSDSPQDGSSSWQEANPDEVNAKQVELPVGFPTDRFTLPTGAVIDDAGERAPDSWFVVLRADSAETSQLQWDELIATNGFVVSDAVETPEGGTAATLTGNGLSAAALSFPQEDGAVLTSYDLSVTG